MLRIYAFFCVAALSIASTSYGGDGSIIRTTPPVPGVYIASLVPSARNNSNANADDIARSTGSQIRHRFPLFNSFSFYATQTVASAVSRDPRVRAVTEAGYGYVTASGSQVASSWGLDRLNQQLLPLDQTYAWEYSGANVVVYVIDTGVTSIADLGGRVIRQENFVTGETKIDDCGAGTNEQDGHGTPVADIIAGSTYGVAKDAKVVSLRAFNCDGRGTSDDILAAMHRMIDLHVAAGAEMAVANLSWIYYPISSLIDAAAMNAISSGIVVVAAAGDGNGNACNYSPAHLGDPSQYSPNPTGASTMTVAGSNLLPSITDPSAYDAMSPTTATGHCVSIFAPADVITLNSAGNPIPFHGTSASVPHVSGVAALHFERTQLANSPSAIQGLIKQNGWVNFIFGVPSDTPNLLLTTAVARHRACCS